MHQTPLPDPQISSPAYHSPSNNIPHWPNLIRSIPMVIPPIVNWAHHPVQIRVHIPISYLDQYNNLNFDSPAFHLLYHHSHHHNHQNHHRHYHHHHHQYPPRFPNIYVNNDQTNQLYHPIDVPPNLMPHWQSVVNIPLQIVLTLLLMLNQ